MEGEFNYIDLFAGCGGLSLGLNQSGWKGVFAIEKSPFAFSTLKHNLIDKAKHFMWPSWLDEKEYDINEILISKKKELTTLRNKVDLVVGGPPCQGFSTAGKRVESDTRNRLINSYIQFIRLVQPKVIFFENVKGFTQRFEKNKIKGIRYSEFVQQELQKNSKEFTGYEVFGKLIDFSEYGIPQKRTRFILVGIRKDFAKKNKKNPKLFFDLLENQKFSFLNSRGLAITPTIEEAISDLLEKNGKIPSPDSKGFFSSVYGTIGSSYQKYMKNNCALSHPDSHRFANHTKTTLELFKLLLKNAPKGKRIEGEERKQYNLKKRGFILLDPNKPSPTLTSHPDDYLHYCEPRILTVREYARIQTFPDWFEFKQKYTTGGKLRKVEVPRYTQVGNAIPPIFGEQAGEALKKMLNAE